MEFSPTEVENFITLFKEHKSQIRNFPGCSHLELFQDTNRENIFFTYSFWDKEESLESYRHSDLFNKIWAKTKVKFSGKPRAWSVRVAG